MSEEEQADEAESAETAEDTEAEGADASDESEEPESTDEADESESESGIQNGDFVRLDYTVRTIPDEDDEDDEGRVVDTTREDVAEEAGIDDDDYDFSPRTIVVGEGHVFASVDEDLVGKAAGDTNTVSVPADEGFGEFDPEDVRTISAEKIPEDDRYPGAQVTVDGDQGYLETVIGGRARVDFNHPLAGDDLEYEYEILELVDDREEQAQGLIGMYLQEVPEVRIETETVEEEVTVEPDEDSETPEESREAGEAGDDEDAEPETETEEVEKESLYIEATPMMQMNQQWMFSKQQIAEDIMDRLDLDRVVIEEVIEGGGGMMGGMGGMMGGMGGMGGGEEMEEALDDVDLDDVDVDADELVEELEDEELDAEE
ncbi:FKBP-type peptidyl-prolyl cis-trans isomerase [Candidatus Halobonum tyrrellensis]|uniref:peptidylprolyl isomerase n=1 Tax=Candidatus Halobonum tyrrellensis G22 TaxID=1324957 RepID=V4GWG7_9EURY|nr:peptidylprolyl isomerase [Candidatus Halobonum tyrrellensis]ESP89501.1 FKBP-type peptidylprolyl isomerase [Candidatus Halobonum tyrrellensis G22]